MRLFVLSTLFCRWCHILIKSNFIKNLEKSERCVNTKTMRSDLIGVANMAGNPGRNKDVTRGAIRINRHTKGLILAVLSGWDLAQLGAECRYNRFIMPGYS